MSDAEGPAPAGPPGGAAGGVGPGAADGADDGARRTRLLARMLLLCACVLVPILRAPLLDAPFERDEGEYAYIAWRMDEGDVPYRDAFDQKPPGVFAAFWASYRLLDDPVVSVHLAVMLWTVLTTLAVGLVGRRVAGPVGGGLAALVFAVQSSSTALLAQAANTELWMVLPMTASVLFLLRGLERERALDWLLTGALVAAACWFKQVAATSGLFVLGAALLARGGRLRRVGWMAAGGLLVSAPVAGAFAAVGAWRPFVDAVFLHNLSYVGSADASQAWDALGLALRKQAPEAWTTWAFAILALVVPQARRRAAFPAVWTASLALGVCSGWYFREHYFIQWLPGLALLAGVAGGTGLEVARRLRARPVAAVPLVLLLLLLPVGFRSGAGGSPTRIARTLYGLNPFAESEELGRRVAELSAPDDTVFVLGSEPQILFHARRRSATRYIFTYPLTGGFPDSVERQREAIAEVEAAEPAVIVVVNVATSHLTAPGQELPLFERMNELVASRYRLEVMAHAVDDEQPYRFLEGDRARRFLARNPAASTVPSVRLYVRDDAR